MIKLNKNLFLVIALVGGSIGFAGCNSGASNTTTTNSTNTTTTKTNNNTGTTTTETKTETKTETASADKIGVPECDDYIAKYEACVNSKVPEAQRATFKTSFDTLRKSWKDAAANPQTKASLATGCKTAHDQAKQSMSAFSCNW